MDRSANFQETQVENLMMPVTASLQTEPFTPLSVRIGLTQPELVQGLVTLKQGIGQERFDQYIESLISLRLREGTLWLVTKRAMHRSLLERDFLPQIKQAFGAGAVRIIVSQG